MAAHRDVVDLQQRRSPIRQAEQTFKAHRMIEIAADSEEPALERLDA